jgi:hypothetical protein
MVRWCADKKHDIALSFAPVGAVGKWLARVDV